MIQIIGWLGCLMLLVKGLEILGGRNSRMADEHLSDTAMWAAGLSIAGAILIAILIFVQGQEIAGLTRNLG